MMDARANTIFIARPVHSIEDLATAIIAAVYGDEEESSTATATADSPQITDPNARPVPHNLDALADLLRETDVNHLVVMNWRMPEELTSKLLHVFANEHIQLTRS